MKKQQFLFALLVLLSTASFSQPLNIGDELSDFSLAVLNAPSEEINKDDLEGKIVLMDFWATWCSPCISSMTHLQELQDEFGDKIQVIAVGNEGKERTQKFIESKGFSIWYGLDDEDVMTELFPHRIIPHVVVIDASGKVQAVTEPGFLNAKAIEDLLAGKDIDLPIKTENMEFDYTVDHFQADTNINESFVIQPGLEGVSTFSRFYPRGPFEGRRFSTINFTIPSLYREAYQTTSYRMVYEVDEERFDYDNTNNLYCLDIIVAPENKENLYKTMREKVTASFPIKARLENREQEVVVLSRIDSIEFDLPASDAVRNISGNGDHYDGQGVTLADFANYLEDFGLVGYAVVDETGIEGKYDINFSFRPEESKTFHEGLKKMGLKVKKAKREIEVLIIYEEVE